MTTSTAAPDRPVGTALIGYGYWGANLARNLAVSETTHLVSIVDPDEGRRQAATRTHPGVRTYAALADAIADPDVEGVVLATPAAMHCEQAVSVLRSGRHVLVEKPLATTTEDAEKIVREAAAQDRIAMVGHTFLYSPPVTRLKDLVQSGELGKIQYVYSQRLSLGRIRRDCSALWNFAPHDMAILLYLLEERPTVVSGRGLSFIEPGNDDVCFATMDFPSGAGANIHVSWIDPRKTRLLTVVGDRKMAVFDDVSTDRKIEIHDAGVARSADPTLGEYASMGEFQWRTRAGDVLIPHVRMSEPLLAEIDAFGRACRSGEPPLTDARHGADVVRILEAIDRSSAMGGAAVDLDWSE